jgi:LPPG:FO 2-phospho-L-lactate transferase
MSKGILALTGGVGGAKLALGLQRVLPAGHLTVVANTGDDFEHLGLSISPDIDTALYTLSGLANPDTGWGRADESWHFMAELQRLGSETWFRLGDKDLALHVERTRRLERGESLQAIIQDVARRLGIATHLLPMSDHSVRTIVETDQGPLGFQDYFVRHQCKPVVQALRYEGAEDASGIASVLQALANNEFAAVVICPSNPYLSIDPILSIPAWHKALRNAPVPVIAVSPVIAGNAVKGPTAKIMGELGLEVSAATVARHYDAVIDGFVLDLVDSHLSAQIEMPTLITQSIMSTLADKEALARATLQFAESLTRRQRT